MQEWLRAADTEATELSERLELGDNESVRKWALHQHPTVIGRVIQNGDWEEFLRAVREIAHMEPGEFERAMQRVLREYE